jgi:lysozyme
MLRQRLIQAALVLGLGGSGALITSAEFIGKHEGEVRSVYLDLGGVRTWCFGQTVGQVPTNLTPEMCAQDLLKSTQVYHTRVMQTMPAEAPASVQAAFTSLAYNVGANGWQTEYKQGRRVPSRFIAPLKAHDWEAACAAIAAPWQGKHGVALGFKATVQGKPVRGLENRRKAEAALCRQDLR